MSNPTESNVQAGPYVKHLWSGATSSIKAQVELGRTMARVYILSQEGVSQTASSAICEAIQEQSRWTKWGFDSEMSKSPYNVRALVSHL